MRGLKLIPVLGASALTASLAVVACNLDGDYYNYGGFGGGRGFIPTGTSSGTSGTGALSEGACASAKAGESCMESAGASETQCEVKRHANIACNGFLDCVGYRWVVRGNEDEDNTDDPADAGDAGDAGKKPTTAFCATECPTAYTVTPPEGTCTIPNARTLICEYPEGTCGCAPVRPLGTDAGDAGKVEDAGPTEYAWQCVKPEDECPRTRPSKNDDCVRPMTCDYGDCVFEDGVKMRCYAQRWTTQKTYKDNCR